MASANLNKNSVESRPPSTSRPQPASYSFSQYIPEDFSFSKWRAERASMRENACFRHNKMDVLDEIPLFSNSSKVSALSERNPPKRNELKDSSYYVVDDNDKLFSQSKESSLNSSFEINLSNKSEIKSSRQCSFDIIDNSDATKPSYLSDGTFQTIKDDGKANDMVLICENLSELLREKTSWPKEDEDAMFENVHINKPSLSPLSSQFDDSVKDCYVNLWSDNCFLGDDENRKMLTNKSKTVNISSVVDSWEDLISDDDEDKIDNEPQIDVVDALNSACSLSKNECVDAPNAKIDRLCEDTMDAGYVNANSLMPMNLTSVCDTQSENSFKKQNWRSSQRALLRPPKSIYTPKTDTTFNRVFLDHLEKMDESAVLKKDLELDNVGHELKTGESGSNITEPCTLPTSRLLQQQLVPSVSKNPRKFTLLAPLDVKLKKTGGVLRNKASSQIPSNSISKPLSVKSINVSVVDKAKNTLETQIENNSKPISEFPSTNSNLSTSNGARKTTANGSDGMMISRAKLKEILNMPFMFQSPSDTSLTGEKSPSEFKSKPRLPNITTAMLTKGKKENISIAIPLNVNMNTNNNYSSNNTAETKEAEENWDEGITKDEAYVQRPSVFSQNLSSLATAKVPIFQRATDRTGSNLTNIVAPFQSHPHHLTSMGRDDSSSNKMTMTTTNFYAMASSSSGSPVSENTAPINKQSKTLNPLRRPKPITRHMLMSVLNRGIESSNTKQDPPCVSAIKQDHFILGLKGDSSLLEYNADEHADVGDDHIGDDVPKSLSTGVKEKEPLERKVKRRSNPSALLLNALNGVRDSRGLQS